MTPLRSFYIDALFRLSTLTWVGILDLILVTVAFYLLLTLVSSSRAAFLLRGIIILGVVLFIVTILLPLPTFDWLVQGLLIAMVIATPIIFQPELRRLLERVGRTAGAGLGMRQMATESVLASLVRAVERLSASHTGALIVLEGRDSLEEIIETGVTIGGQVTSELLQAIFYPENPLHDGAVILREDRLVAASCVLPLTQHPIHSRRRLGTRHRAAVGLSETSDALVIVVSEETGHISVARDGALQRLQDITGLREQLVHFFLPSGQAPTTPSVWQLIKQAAGQVWPQPARPDTRQMISSISLWLVALLLAMVAWTVVVEQTNPAQRERIDNIPLRVQNIPPGTTLVQKPPETISALIQTTAQSRQTLTPGSFQATISLADVEPGLQTVPVGVNVGADQVRVLEVFPSAITLELAPIISRTFQVSVDLQNQQSLSPVYQVVGMPVTFPNEVRVTGPEPLVAQVSRVRAPLSLANTTGSVREFLPVQAIDEAGNVLSGLDLEPEQVQVSLSIRRRLNALDVGVHAAIEGTPAPGYWLSGVDINPASVTLQGNPEQLAEIGSFVNTLPIDMSGAAGDLTVQIPLVLPPDVQAFDSEGNVAESVTVTARVMPRTGDLAISRPVELAHAGPGVTVSPAQIDLLLSGPLPTLGDIEAQPQLVRVLIDATGLEANQSVEVTPTVIAPEDIQVQLVPATVLVTVPAEPPG